MLREFVQCGSAEERLALVSEENAALWNDGEVDVALDIVGVKKEGTIEEKLSSIREMLHFNYKDALSDEFIERARKIADEIQDASDDVSEFDLKKIQLLYGVTMFQSNRVTG